MEADSSARKPPATRNDEPTADTASLGTQALNALSTGVAVVDLRARVLLANAIARRLFACAGIFRRAPALALRARDANDALHLAIARAATNASTALQLRDAETRAIVNAVVLPLPALPGWSAALTRGVALLTMSEPAYSHAIPDHWLAQMFGLTRAEALVANWLVSGRTIDAYAQHRGVSLETARSQLKSVLSKTGMSRQVQLVAALSRLPIEQPST